MSYNRKEKKSSATARKQVTVICNSYQFNYISNQTNKTKNMQLEHSKTRQNEDRVNRKTPLTTVYSHVSYSILYFKWSFELSNNANKLIFSQSQY